MKHDLTTQIIFILASTALFAASVYLLSIYNRLFRKITNSWLRNNLAVLIIGMLVMCAFISIEVPSMMAQQKPDAIIGLLIKRLGHSCIIILFVFNVVAIVSRIPLVKSMTFIKHHSVIFVAIIVSSLFIYAAINYIDNGGSLKELHATLIYAYFNSALTGLIYTGFRYVELERRRKLNEKEHEVTKLIALKTKAELDALHSKVNPHFLYNALNSIADLSITDGKKARRMTIALADLFRYSINYSNNNYTTVKDEVEMSDVYLQIEKIRFEDQLNYTLTVEEGLGHYLVPRFILQPLVENAVKHGLKATGRMTEILVEVKREEDNLVIRIKDNGPVFPEEMNPGYGVKSVFDKLDLLFPGQYQIHFKNNPEKEVSLFIHKLVKDESAI